ncbi:MAG: hypothetical protein ABIM73_04035 [Arenimonas sp.]
MLADAIEASINSVAFAIELIGSVFMAEGILFCCANVKASVDHIATPVPALLHTVAAVSGLG